MGDFLRTAQAAVRLRVSSATVRRLVDAGKLDAVRTPGRHRRITAESVQRLYDDSNADE